MNHMELKERGKMELEIPRFNKFEEYMYWAETINNSGVPRQSIDDSLLQVTTHAIHYDFQSVELLSKVEREIMKLMVERNLVGYEWEKNNSVGLAVVAYEKNIRDLFKGSYPYERLRIIYSRYGLYDKAKCICEQYLELKRHPLGYDEAKRSSFIDMIEKLSEKQTTRRDFSLLYKNLDEETIVEEFCIEGKKMPLQKGKAFYQLNHSKTGTIEELIQDYVSKDGYKGLWTENDYWWMIMSLLFWDVIFTPIPGMFVNNKNFPKQDMPLDFFDIDFYIRRHKEIKMYLSEMKKNNKSTRNKIERTIKKNYCKYFGMPCRSIEDWGKYPLNDLLFVVKYLEPYQLAIIIERLITYFNEYRRGLPDLFVVKDNIPCFIECKEKNEKIQLWQKSWHIYIQKKANIPVKICRVESM